MAKKAISKHDKRIYEQTKKNIDKYTGASDILIKERIKSLSKEWNINKMFNFLMWNVNFIFILLGFLNANIWFFFSLCVSFISIVNIILNLHIEKYLLRPFDFRTRKEISDEILVLRIMINKVNDDDFLALYDALKKEEI